MMNQTSPQPWQPQPWEIDAVDLASADEVWQLEDWVSDDIADEIREIIFAPDTIPSPPPDAAVERDLAHVTIPAPPPLGSLGGSNG